MDDVPIGIAPHARAQQHAVENLRGGGPQQPAGGGVERDIGLGNAAGIVQDTGDLLRRHVGKVFHETAAHLHQRLDGVDFVGHHGLQVGVVSPVHEENADDGHDNQGQDQGGQEDKVDARFVIVLLEQLCPPSVRPGHKIGKDVEQQQQEEDGNQVVGYLYFRAGNEDGLVFRNLVYETGIVLVVEVPLKGSQVAVYIFSIGVPGRQDDLARSGIAQQAGIATVFPVGLGLYAHEDAAAAIAAVIEIEPACVAALSIVVPRVIEIAGDGRSVADAVPDIGPQSRRKRAPICHGNGNVVVLRHPYQVILGQAVQDDAGAVVQSRQGGDDRIPRNGFLHLTELDFQGDVAVHGQARRPDLHGVLLFLETQGRGCRHQIDRCQGGKYHAGGPGERIEAPARPRTDDRSHQLQQQGDAQQQQHQRQQHHARPGRQPVKFIQFQADVGVHDDAPERTMHVDENAQEDNRHAADKTGVGALPLPIQAPENIHPDGIGIEDSHEQGQVHDEQGPQ